MLQAAALTVIDVLIMFLLLFSESLAASRFELTKTLAANGPRKAACDAAWVCP
jgi:hypothetical protein